MLVHARLKQVYLLFAHLFPCPPKLGGLALRHFPSLITRASGVNPPAAIRGGQFRDDNLRSFDQRKMVKAYQLSSTIPVRHSLLVLTALASLVGPL